MKRTGFTKNIAVSVLSLGLVLGSISNVSAFKGMGANPQPAEQQSSSEEQASKIMGHQGNADLIVATINGTEITMGALMSGMLDIIKKSGYSGDSLTAELGRRVRSEALEKIAMEELAYQRAVSLGISPDPAVVESYVESSAQQQGGREALEKILAEKNKSIADLKNEITRYLAVKEAIRQEVEDKVTVSDEEIDIVYNNNRKEFVTEERVVVTDIIFFVDPADPASREKVLAVRNTIINELDNNPARLNAQGLIVENQINVSPENKSFLYDQAKKMKTGELSQPLLLDGTLHLIKLDLYQPASEKPVDESKAYVAKEIRSAKYNDLLRTWRSSLMQDAEIKIINETMQETETEK